MKVTFDLVHEPWLPVRRKGGEATQLGLMEVLVGAHGLTRIEDPSPLVQGGLHRLLLAVLHRALMGPRDNTEAQDLLDAGHFPEEAISSYLKRYGARFNLFHDKQPFYQVADFNPPADKLAPITRLIAEASCGNNATLFDHSVDTDVQPRSAGEVARLLVAHQTFALGSGRSALGYTYHAPVATSALTLALGETLFETLVLNLVPYDPDGDTPVWERPALGVNEFREGRISTGLSDRYTWQSRAVRLLPHTCKDGPVVTRLAYAAGLESMWTDDPMVAYRAVEGVGTLPFSFRLNRAVWRDFRALVPTPESAYTPPAVLGHAATLGKHRPIQPVMVVGLISDKAKILNWRTEVLPLPRVLLKDEALKKQLGSLLEWANTLGRELGSAQRRVAEGLISPNGTPDRSAVTRLAESIPLTRSYWSQAEIAFGELLDRLTASPEVESWWKDRLANIAMDAWQETVQAVGTTPRTLRALQPGERTVRYALRAHA